MIKLSNERAALTAEELGMLKDLLNAGDRGGYYMAYHAMTGSREALVQAKIATFSGAAGGIALAANRFGQDLLTPGTPLYAIRNLFPNDDINKKYPGMYYLSQEIAKSSFLSIEKDATGNITDKVFFTSARDAWAAEGMLAYFPANILSFLLPWSSYRQDTSNSLFFTPGFWASAFAGLASSSLKKRASDYGSNVTKIDFDSPNDEFAQIFVDGNGRVTFVDARLLEDTAGDTLSAAVTAAQLYLSAIYLTALAATGVSIVTTGEFKLTSAAILTLLQFPLPINSSVRSGFTETNTGFNGDLKPENTNTDLTAVKISWATGGTDGRDVLTATLANPIQDGKGGDDLVFGVDGSDTLIGGAGNDVIWGRAGADFLWGDDKEAVFSGNDIIRRKYGDSVQLTP
jgi:Ca2+-binding RTX toxin-like protein